MAVNKIYANSIIKAKEASLLDGEKIRKILDALTAKDVFKVLFESGYDESLFDSASDFDQIISKERKKCVDLFVSLCADSALLEAVLTRYDFHNAKVFYKEAHKTSPQALYDIGLIPLTKMETVFASKRYNELPDRMAEAIYRLEEIKKTQPLLPRMVDIELDKACFVALSSAAKKIKDKKIKKYFVAEADFKNLMTVLRCKMAKLNQEEAQNQFVAGGKLRFEEVARLFLPEEEWSYSWGFYQEFVINAAQAIKNKDVSLLNNYISQTLSKILEAGKNDIFSLIPLFWFYKRKTAELKLVKLILVCKNNKIPLKQLQEHLEVAYGI